MWPDDMEDDDFVPSRFDGMTPPPMDDSDSIDDEKFRQVIDCRLNSALHNAGVDTIGDLRALLDSERLYSTKNIGNVGRMRIKFLLGEQKSALTILASQLRRTTAEGRVQWFRGVGEALRAAGLRHTIVDDLCSYSE